LAHHWQLAALQQTCHLGYISLALQHGSPIAIFLQFTASALFHITFFQNQQNHCNPSESNSVQHSFGKSLIFWDFTCKSRLANQSSLRTKAPFLVTFAVLGSFIIKDDYSVRNNILNPCQIVISV
jgi:hypothetical protein